MISRYVIIKYKKLEGGDSIGRVLIIESNARSVPVIDEILEKLKDHPSIEFLWLKHEPGLSLPGLEIDLTHRRVFCNSQEVNLTAKEYEILCLLAVNKGQILTYEQIYRKVWKEEAFGNANNAIKCHIRNLREKLYGTNPNASFIIRCVREVGYCLEADSEETVIT